MSCARRVDIECTRPVWWQRRKRFQPCSVFCVMRPLASGRILNVSRVLSANSSAAGGGGGGGVLRFFFVATLGAAILGVDGVAVAGGICGVVAGATGAPDGDGVGSAGACARAIPPMARRARHMAAQRIRLSVFATGLTVKL